MHILHFLIFICLFTSSLIRGTSDSGICPICFLKILPNLNLLLFRSSCMRGKYRKDIPYLPSNLHFYLHHPVIVSLNFCYTVCYHCSQHKPTSVTLSSHPLHLIAVEGCAALISIFHIFMAANVEFSCGQQRHYLSTSSN